MAEFIETDLCVIGAGAAGLAVAAGAVQMGARVVIVEDGRMGGDCLNYGCVPSKALLAAAKAAKAGDAAGRFGIRYAAPEIDYKAVHDHVKGVIAAIAPHDSQERFEKLGCTVLRSHARFTGPDEVAAGEHRIRAKRFVVATGSRPAVPPVPGIDDVDYLTNETVFDLETLPASMIIMGGGPIGCELGSAFRRLGSEVTVVEMGRILPRDDSELVATLRQTLVDEGVKLEEGAKVVDVAPGGAGVEVTIETAEGKRTLTAARLLVAAGRAPGIDSLGLENAGVDHDKGGITVDRRLRSSNRRVYALGDVAGGPQFTHVAGHHASVLIKNALFRLPAKVEARAIPWVTYTDPELAHVGLTEEQAREEEGDIRVLRAPFAENDRAQAERNTEGMAKVVTDRRGRVLGCSILGSGAGDLLLPWILAVSKREKVGDLAQVIAPYPTRSEASKRAAGSFYTDSLFSDRTRWLVRLLLRLP